MSTPNENGTSKSASSSRTRKKVTATSDAKADTAKSDTAGDSAKSDATQKGGLVKAPKNEIMELATTESLPGHRPVAVSTLDISDLDTLPGHRPIASNDIDEDPSTLMGYLD